MSKKLEAGILFEIHNNPPTQPLVFGDVKLNAAESGSGSIVLSMNVTISKAQIIPPDGKYFDEKYLLTCAYFPFKKDTNDIDFSDSTKILFEQGVGDLTAYFHPSFAVKNAKIGGAGPQ